MDSMTQQYYDDPPAADEPLVVDLNTETVGSSGAVWSLPHGGDLDANLVSFDAKQGVDEHVNDDVDVLMVVLSGGGELRIGSVVSSLGPNHVALIPKGFARSITAGSAGISYMSVHRQRGPLTIADHPPVNTPPSKGDEFTPRPQP
jgi:quercetin dioxygenase-like cupin family protein